MSGLLSVLWNYFRAGQLSFTSRSALRLYQERKLRTHLKWVSQNSSYYREFENKPLEAWPLVDKKACLANFNTMNTVGLQLDKTMHFALAAENMRDFDSTLSGYTIGLSSGTSGTRGLFVASPRERTLWAGLALRRLLPEGIFRGERIAFFLRANSKLYTSVKTPLVSFKFFDLMAPLESQLNGLALFKPSIIVAPAQVLRYLALKQQKSLISLAPKKVISVAEVLEDADRELMLPSFPLISQVYQATEGFLGYTCSHGRLHLNEEYLHIEPEWQDEHKTRMVPIITDFSRTSQPIIRYRLNDMLAINPTVCPCGNPTLTLAHIEGRCDDQLSLPGRNGIPIPIFGDVMSRILLRSLPLSTDYRLVQTGNCAIRLTALLGPAKSEVMAKINCMLQDLGVAVESLHWTVLDREPVFDPMSKRRRITRLIR